MSEENNLSEWQEPVSQTPLSLEQMDQLVQDLAKKRLAHEESKKITAEKYKEVEEAEKLILNALKSAGKTKYEAEGVALVYIQDRETYTVPKDPTEKEKLFKYITERYGRDTLMQMVGINFQTLNGWAKKEAEANPLVQIPGLALPTSEEILFFRSKK